MIGGPLKLGAKGVAAGAGAVMGAMKSVGAKESGVLLQGGKKGIKPFDKFPSSPSEMTRILGVEPKKVTLTPDGTQRVIWEPNSNTRIRFESHPEGLRAGDAGFNPRHHGEHYHVELKPDGVSWNQANKQGLITKVKPENYSPGMGTGFLHNEKFPGN